MDKFMQTIRSMAGAWTAVLRRGVRSVIDWLGRRGLYPDGDGVRRAEVPGARRTVPLYLLAPGASRGLGFLALRTAMVFVSTVATIALTWASVAVAMGATDTGLVGRLGALTVVAWFVALLTVEWAWASRPKQRPFNCDLDRW